jgi:predicted  nucleic acid-binding Zn-ribbon protein
MEDLEREMRSLKSENRALKSDLKEEREKVSFLEEDAD